MAIVAIVAGSGRLALADPDTGSGTGSASSAGSASSPQPASATTLFEEGRTLARKGDFVGACDRFQRSLALDPAALGTALNLADCYEKRALTSRAWHLFDQVARRAGTADDQVKAKFARDRADKLVVQLAHVDLHVPAPRPPGLAITINGDPVVLPDDAATDVHELADPGTITVVATAPGQAPVHDELRAAAGATAAVPIEFTAPVGVRRNALEPGGSVGDDQHRKTAWVGSAIVVGAVGLVATGLGVGFGIAAHTDHEDAVTDGCRQSGGQILCPPLAAGTENLAVHRADQATAFTIAGLALLAGGAVLFLEAPREREHLAVAPVVGAGEIGVALGGGF
jgi:hypothetical protein